MIVVGTKKLNLGGGIGCEIISGVVLVKKLLGMGNEGSRGGGGNQITVLRGWVDF